MSVRPAALLITAFVFILVSFGNVFSQGMFPSIAISGGPTAGWSFIKISALNDELRKGGFPELSDKGFFTLGGGGFIDLPISSSFIRIGGMGVGFETNEESQVNDSLTKAVTYSYGMGGLSFEYVKTFGVFDVTFGALFSTGTLKLDLYQYGSDHGSYGTILGEFTNNSSSTNITRNYGVRFYSIQPQAGFGVILKKFLYLRLVGGYQLPAQGTWKVDNDVEVRDFPKEIKAQGFNISLGLNVGLFFRD